MPGLLYGNDKPFHSMVSKLFFLLLTFVGHKLCKNWKNKIQTVGKNCLFFIWYTTVSYVHRIKLKLFLVTRFLDSDVYRFFAIFECHSSVLILD